jgi:hypothetical protein
MATRAGIISFTLRKQRVKKTEQKIDKEKKSLCRRQGRKAR